MPSGNPPTTSQLQYHSYPAMSQMTEEMPPVDNNELIHSGYIYKRNKSHQWQRRWLVLRRNQLSYYKDSKEYKASKVINISDILSISVIPDNHKFHFIVVTNRRIYHLKCSEEKEFETWIRLFNDAYHEHNKEFESESTKECEEKVIGCKKSQLEKFYHQDQRDFEYTKPVNVSDIDFSNFHLSGTDDNFTSGQGSDSNTINQSSSSLPLPALSDQIIPQIPTPIQEEDFPVLSQPPKNHPIENNIATEPNPFNRPELTSRPSITYFNSFSKNQPEHIITSGPLYRLKKRYNQWRKYQVVLTNQFLYFYKSQKDYEHQKLHKRISLDDIIDVVELEALSKSKVYCMLIITPWKRVRFCAEDEEALVEWLVYLKTVLKTRTKEKKGQ